MFPHFLRILHVSGTHYGVELARNHSLPGQRVLSSVGFARLDGRLEAMQERIEKLQERMETLLEKGLREQTRFFFLAWSVLLAAIVGLYAR